ncbi:hypothetical protein BH10BDE1_BH10BDE1_08490 [soil metagenome]
MTVRHLPVRFALPAGALALALGMSACAFKTDKEKPVENPRLATLEQQLEANRPIFEADLTFKFIPQEKLKAYKALVSWRDPGTVSLTVDFGDSDVRTFEPSKPHQFLLDCKNDIVQFEVESYSADGRRLTRFPVSRKCPIDLEINGLFSDLKALNAVTGRLNLMPGAKIAVTDQPLNINVDTLTIDVAASIETFSSNRDPKWNLGPSTIAPNISIKAATAIGFLSIALNGVDGAPLRDTEDTEDASLNGADGADGEADTFVTPSSLKGMDYGLSKVRCTKRPTNGQNGKPSTVIKGERGRPGNRGIGTSTVRLEIANAEHFKTEVLFNPGFASQPTRGSVYKGGKPGKAGQAPPPCKTAADGKLAGRSSERGDPGATANNGGCGLIYVSGNMIRNLMMRDISTLACSRSVGLVQPL